MSVANICHTASIVNCARIFDPECPFMIFYYLCYLAQNPSKRVDHRVLIRALREHRGRDGAATEDFRLCLSSVVIDLMDAEKNYV